jgi:hypothetical protein
MDFFTTLFTAPHSSKEVEQYTPVFAKHTEEVDIPADSDDPGGGTYCVIA